MIAYPLTIGLALKTVKQHVNHMVMGCIPWGMFVDLYIFVL